MNPRLQSVFFTAISLAAIQFTSLPAIADDAPATTLTQSYRVNSGGKLVVRIDRGTVRIAGGEGSTAEIEVVRKVTHGSGDKAQRLLEKHEVRFSQDGDTVRLDAEVKGADRSNWKGPQLEVEVKVTLPKDFNVEVDTAGGGIHASRLKGNLNLKTSGGGLTLEALEGTVNGRTSGGSIRASRVAGAIELSTSGGNIQVNDARGEKLKVSTSGGSINLAGIAVPVDAHTSGGSIQLESTGASVQAGTSGGSISASYTSPPKGEAVFKTSAGGVTLTLPEASAFQLDASTSAGSVHSDFPISVAKSSDNRSVLKGPANGGGPVIKLRSSAGSIRVKKG